MALNSIIQCCRGQSNRLLCYSVSNPRFLNTSIKQYGNSLNKCEEKKKSKAVKFYILQRAVQYIQNYETHLGKHFPKTMQVYRVFTEGVHIFFKDLKDYAKVMKIVYTTSPTLEKLTRRELELYYQMPRDVAKVAPTLLMSSLPFSLYLVLPLVYLYPRQFLTSHFWTLQQKSEFKTAILTNRLNHNRSVFRHLQAHLRSLKSTPLHKRWSNVLGQLGSGVQPSVEQILDCKELFANTPYSLKSLSRNHLFHLAKIHEIGMFFRRRKLRERAMIIQAMDRAIMREGGVHNMPLDAMKNACFIRGLNPINMKNEDIIHWLRQWVAISCEVDSRTISLLLHSPIFSPMLYPFCYSTTVMLSCYEGNITEFCDLVCCIRK